MRKALGLQLEEMYLSLETSDAEIAQIFTRLKIGEAGYPPRLLEARRIEFKQRVAEICLGRPIVFNRQAHSERNSGGNRHC